MVPEIWWTDCALIQEGENPHRDSEHDANKKCVGSVPSGKEKHFRSVVCCLLLYQVIHIYTPLKIESILANVK